MNQIWVDKYRPKKFNEIIGQDFFVKRIQAFLKTKNLPHLLFSGAAGTGKTSTALVVATELYGENGVKGNFLELNASDDRGIDIIRNQIKEFAKLKSLAQVPYKIIVLDEADSLTKEAQQALRRTMERYSATCRFILCCNEMSKIIDPIQSRCVIFKFKGLNDVALKHLTKKIASLEGLKLDVDSESLLIKISNGDVRKLINTMQAVAAIDKKVTVKLIEEILDYVNPKEVEEMLKHAINGDFFKAREEMIKLRVLRGLSALEILKEIYRQVIEMNLDSKVKIKLVDRIGTIEFRLVEGSDSELQLESLLAMIGMIRG